MYKNLPNLNNNILVLWKRKRQEGERVECDGGKAARATFKCWLQLSVKQVHYYRPGSLDRYYI